MKNGEKYLIFREKGVANTGEKHHSHQEGDDGPRGDDCGRHGDDDLETSNGKRPSRGKISAVP